MTTAFFPGKFVPYHLGHVLSLMRIYNKYDKIIIGITEDVPKDSDFTISQKERKRVFEEVLQYLPKFKVVLIKGTIEGSKSGDNLPEFDICLSGNRNVIKTIRSFGKKAEYLPRSKGYGFSGTEIRRGIK